MSDAAVDFLLDNLKQHLAYDVDLIMNVRDEVNGLISDLPLLKALLEVSTEIGSEDKVVKGLVSRIRPVIFEAEDAIDAYMLGTPSRKGIEKRVQWINKVFGDVDPAYRLREVAKKVQTIREKVENQNPMLLTALHGRDPADRTRVERRLPEVEKKNVVGFDEAAATLIDRLTGKTKDLRLQVVSIIGMGGLGKTTLAGKVYYDPRVVDSFSTRAWIYVSQTYTKNDLLLSILKSEGQAITATDEKSLVEKVHHHLTWKYLILVDDVWDKKDWDNIKDAFPDHNNGSKILLTSRNKPVAEHADQRSPPYELNFLTHDQSWELLQTKVFGQGCCPQNLRDLGFQIARQCAGLPIAVVVIAGMLQNDISVDAWETIGKNIEEFLVRNVDDLIEVLALSYYHLPSHLKACFLYLGVFPEDYEIPVWILIRLWIAERFVQTSENLCLEEMAEEHLNDLVTRNLLMVENRSLGGRIKACRMHDLLRDFCWKEALAENFLLEMKEGGSNLSSYETSAVSTISRRLCVHSGVWKYISTFLPLPVRSFLCFAKDQALLPKEHIGIIPEEFKFLRVYHIQPVLFPRFPVELFNLVHLTYLAFSANFTAIPPAMSNLRNLQTLIAETYASTHTISFQANLLGMPRFRHLYTNKATRLYTDKAAFFNESLQTLSTVTPESCMDNFLGHTPCLKKLGIRGNLVTLLEWKGGSLFDLNKLKLLGKLKLCNDVFPDPPSEHRLQGLPRWDKFPPNLKRLTLEDTFLEWDQMHVLGMLPKLEELKLKDNAFTGVCWTSVDGGFKKLKALQIWKADLVYWEAKADHFPSLQHIFIKDCRRLLEIPFGLGDVNTLQTIKLHQTSREAAISARKIKEKQQESNNEIKVDIFPPDL